MTAGTWVRTGRAAIVVAGVVAAAGSAYLQVRNGDPGPKVALTVTAELAFIAAGLVARARWPANRTGLLMVLVGVMMQIFLDRFADAFSAFAR